MTRAVTFQHNPAGWRAFERSADVGNAMERIAREIASKANAEGTSNYHARQVPDPGGQNNTLRAAAEVYTDKTTAEDSADRRLISTAYAYRIRGIG